MSVLIFHSFTSLNPLVSVILMCGVYEFSSVRYTFESCIKKCMKQNPARCCTTCISQSNDCENKVPSGIKWIMTHFAANLLKLGAIVPLLISTENNARIQIAIASICLIALSLIWSKKLQKSTFSASEHSKFKAKRKLKASKVKGRWKASKYYSLWPYQK